LCWRIAIALSSPNSGVFPQSGDVSSRALPLVEELAAANPDNAQLAQMRDRLRAPRDIGLQRLTLSLRGGQLR